MYERIDWSAQWRSIQILGGDSIVLVCSNKIIGVAKYRGTYVGGMGQ